MNISILFFPIRLSSTRPKSTDMQHSGAYHETAPSQILKAGQFDSRFLPSASVQSRIASFEGNVIKHSKAREFPDPREECRANFGKRRSPIFASPASRTSNANEPHRTPNAHSFLGLNATRANLRQDSTSAAETSQWTKTTGLHGQLRPRGIIPDGYIRSISQDHQGLFGSKSYANIQQRAPWKGVSALKQTKSSAQLSDIHRSTPWQESIESRQLAAQPSCSPQSRTERWRDELLETGLDSRLNSSCHAEPVGWNSDDDTSTDRRRSVRNLFDDFGVDHPPGLLSSDFVAEELEAPQRLPQQFSHCHRCMSINDTQVTHCWICGHTANANSYAPRSLSTSKGTAEHTSSAGHEDRKMPRWSTTRVSSKSRRMTTSPSAKPSSTSNPANVPNFRRSQHPKSVSTGEAKDLRKTQSFVRHKNNPFILADNLSPQDASRLQPFTSRLKYQVSHEHRNTQSPDTLQDVQESSVEHANRDTDTCTDPRTKVEDGTVVGQHDVQKNNSRNHPEHSYLSGHVEYNHLRSSPHTLSPPHVVNSPFLALEYVECHGYPRTGHDFIRQGSPSEAGYLGACQHCLNDCQCSGCQNVDHSVRCCVHPSHDGHTMVHRHPATAGAVILVPAEARFQPGTHQFRQDKQTSFYSVATSPLTKEANELGLNETTQAKDNRFEVSIRNRRKSARMKASLQREARWAYDTEPPKAEPELLILPGSPMLTAYQENKEVIMPQPRRQTKSPPWINAQGATTIGISRNRDELVKPSIIKKKSAKEGNSKKFKSISAKKSSFPAMKEGTSTRASSVPSARESTRSRFSARRLSQLFSRIGMREEKLKRSPSTPLLNMRLEEEKEKQEVKIDRQSILERQREKGKVWDVKLSAPTDDTFVGVAKSEVMITSKADADMQMFKPVIDASSPVDERRGVTGVTMPQRKGTARRSSTELGILGISIVIHMEGRKDLVLKTDLSRAT